MTSNTRQACEPRQNASHNCTMLGWPMQRSATYNSYRPLSKPEPACMTRPVYSKIFDSGLIASIL